MDSGSFSMKNSLATKGVAILMMLWHHCFLEGRFEQYSVHFWPLAQSQAVNIASACKICVSLFAFISGYGLYLAYQKHGAGGKNSTKWILQKEIRTLSNYWFILILAWIICSFLDNRPYQIYGFETSVFMGVWNMLMEFLGLTNLAAGGLGGLLNEDWWYMSAAVVYIILLPLIYAGFERLGCLYTIGMVFILPRLLMGNPGGTEILSFFPIFCFGMMFAKYDLFHIWRQFWGRWKGKTAVSAVKFAAMLVLLGLAYKLYYHLPLGMWRDVQWSLFPLLLILFLYDYIFSCPILNEVLIMLGRHATNIFLIHNFIRSIYGSTFIYGTGRHFVPIYLLLLSCSLVCSFMIELLKKAVHYEDEINRLLRIVENVNAGI